MASSIESVGSYTVVMAETFAAVGLSTIVPTALIAVAQIGKGALVTPKTIDASATPPTTQTFPSTKDIHDSLSDFKSVQSGLDIIEAMGNSLDTFNVLMPKTASIDSSFTFEGADKTTAGASLSGQIQLATVNAGFSALYESQSSNTITMKIHFSLANIKL